MNREALEGALHKARYECLTNGHEWDVADAMAAILSVTTDPDLAVAYGPDSKVIGVVANTALGSEALRAHDEALGITMVPVVAFRKATDGDD